MRRDDTWDGDEPDVAGESYAAGVDFLAQYVPTDAATGDFSVVGEASGDDDAHSQPSPGVWFTVVNPSGVLSASAALGGRLGHVEVKDVSQFDEARLGQEIVEIAALASDRARAAQHEVTVELMGRRGQDRVGVSAFLERSIGLPSFETTSARAAEAFAERYRSHDD